MTTTLFLQFRLFALKNSFVPANSTPKNTNFVHYLLGSFRIASPGMLLTDGKKWPDYRILIEVLVFQH